MNKISLRNKLIDLFHLLPTWPIPLLLRLREHWRPDLVNALVNTIEAAHCLPILRSYPPAVSLSLTSHCNRNCAWCVRQEDIRHLPDTTLEEVKDMTWLRYVNRLWLWGGLGEPLQAEKFQPIFQWIRRTFPHLNIHLSINGELLDKYALVLINELDELNISDPSPKAVKNLEYFMSYKEGFSRPKVGLSKVLYRSDQDPLPVINLCHELDCDWVRLYHYDPLAYSYGNRRLPYFESLQEEAAYWDVHIASAINYARELGVTLRHVPSRPGSKGGSSTCPEPWLRMLLMRTWDGRRIMQPCCSRDQGWGMEWNRLDGESIMGLWNHLKMQEIRRGCKCRKEA